MLDLGVAKFDISIPPFYHVTERVFPVTLVIHTFLMGGGTDNAFQTIHR